MELQGILTVLVPFDDTFTVSIITINLIFIEYIS